MQGTINSGKQSVKRRYLVETLPLAADPSRKSAVPTFIILTDKGEIQVRKSGDSYLRSYRVPKGKETGREGIELRMSEDQFERLWETGEGSRLEKVKTTIKSGHRTIYVISYLGANSGTHIAETWFRSDKDADKFQLGKPEWMGRDVTNDPYYSHKEMAVRERSSPLWEEIRSRNTKVVSQLIENATASIDRAHALHGGIEFHTFRRMVDSIEPVRPQLGREFEVNLNDDGKERRKIIARAEVMGRLQVKYSIDGETIAILDKNGNKVSDAETMDHYISPDMGVEKKEGENFRVREVYWLSQGNPVVGANGERRSPDTVILYYNAVPGKGQSCSWEIKPDATKTLYAAYFMLPQLLAKHRVGMEINGIVVNVDRDVTKVVDTGDGKIVSHLGNFIELPVAKNREDKGRIDEIIDMLRLDKSRAIAEHYSKVY
jgi:CYTH domain-containing protein